MAAYLCYLLPESDWNPRGVPPVLQVLVGLYKGDYSPGENPCILKILFTGLGMFKCFIWSRHFEKEKIGLKGWYLTKTVQRQLNKNLSTLSLSVNEKGNNFLNFSKWMQSKRTAFHNIISTFYSLTPMSHFSLFAH